MPEQNIIKISQLDQVSSIVETDFFAISRGTKSNKISAGDYLKIEHLLDTNINSLGNNHILIYNSATSDWENKNLGSSLDTFYVNKTGDSMTGNLSIENSSNLSVQGDFSVSGDTILHKLRFWQGVEISEISNDSGFTSSDDESIATTLAIKDYIDGKVDILSLSSLTDVELLDETEGEALVYSGGTWKNVYFSSDLSGLTDTDINYLNDDDILVWSGDTWVNNQPLDISTLGFLSGDTLLHDLSGVTTSNLSADDILVYDGSEWFNSGYYITSGETFLLADSYYVVKSGDTMSGGLSISTGGLNVTGGITGDTLILTNGSQIDTIVEESGTTELTNVIYTEKALKEYIQGQISSIDELSELNDVDFSILTSNQILSYNGINWDNSLTYSDSLTYNLTGDTILSTEGSIIGHLEDMSEKRNVFTGFENYNDSSFNITGRNLTISATSSSFNVYYKGKQIEITSSSIEISDVVGSHYIYFDINGDLQELVNPSQFNILKLIQGEDYGVYASYVYWNGVDLESTIFGVERHSIKRNSNNHIYNHLTQGTQHESGAFISDYVLDSDDNNDVKVSISPGYFWDEDQRFYFENGVNNSDFKQPLNILESPMIYKDGSIWRKYDSSLLNGFLFVTGTTGVLYNEIDQITNSGTTEEITSTGYTYTYIAETNDPRHPVILIQGQDIKTSLSEAENDALSNFANLNLQGIPFQELKIIWIVLGYADNTLINDGKYTISKTIDVRDNQFNVLSGVATTSTNTASLIITDTNNFDNILSGSDTNVQQALETIDDITLSNIIEGTKSGDTLIWENDQWTTKNYILPDSGTTVFNAGTTTNYTIADITEYKSVIIDYSLWRSNSDVQTGRIYIVHNGTTTSNLSSEFINTNGNFITFSTDISGNYLRLIGDVISGTDVTIKYNITRL
jgi:hypothetical protein